MNRGGFFSCFTEVGAQFKGWVAIDEEYTQRFLPKYTLALSEETLLHICDTAILIAEPLVIRVVSLAVGNYIKSAG